MSELVQIDCYDALYNDGRGLCGAAMHPQVYIRHGFTCDRGIKCVIEALWAAGLETLFSCENENYSERNRSWMIPEARIGFTHNDPHVLLDFCIWLRAQLMVKHG